MTKPNAARPCWASWQHWKMADLLTGSLPMVWHGRPIDPDFRHMVQLANAYAHGEFDADPPGKAWELCRSFYLDLKMPPLDEAYSGMIEFYTAGEDAAKNASDSHGGTASNVPAFDYRCDAGYIVAAFQQAYGIDLTREKMHWFRFRALFAALPEDTLMAKIMSWRTMDLSEYEGKMREHYAELQQRFALPAELRGGARIESVEEHDAAFLARFRY